MIEGRTILCFASGYDAPPTSKHHVMHVLAERNVVLWVNYHASRTPSATSSDLASMARKLRQVFAGLTSPRKNLYVLTPLVVPLPASAWARRLNRTLLVRQIRRALAKVQAGPVQIWSFTPDVSYLLGRFGEEKVLYYCVDDHASFTGYNRGQVLRDEEDLCRRADLVVTTSLALQEAKTAWNPNTILVTHGVDYGHFSKALSNNLPTPADIAAIPRPRLGFMGLIRDWVDLDLLAEVAHRRPDWHIVLIGDGTVDLSPYRQLPNLHFLGRKPYEELPAYCKQFDVGLIPFKLNDLTRAVNPIKLREYLAAGLPVVSTPLPEVDQYKRWVRTAVEPDDFGQAIENELRAAELNGISAIRDPQEAEPAVAPVSAMTRSFAMRKETWPTKVAAISRQLAAHFQQFEPTQSSSGEKARRKVLIVSAGGGFSIQVRNLLRSCPKALSILVVGPEEAELSLRRQLDAQPFTFLSFRGRRQRRSRTLVGSLPDLILGTLCALRIVWRERPQAVVGLGQRAAVYFLLAARLFGIRTSYVECITRVTKPSTTARIIAALRLADRIYVQWPDATRQLPGSVYGGRLV